MKTIITIRKKKPAYRALILLAKELEKMTILPFLFAKE